MHVYEHENVYIGQVVINFNSGKFHDIAAASLDAGKLSSLQAPLEDTGRPAQQLCFTADLASV